MKLSIPTAVVMTVLLSSMAWANKNTTTKNLIEVKDVETIMDDLNKYSGKVVRVTGEIEDKIDSRSAVLESGGIFNDEIIIISGPNLKGSSIDSLKEDTNVTVTGTVVMKPITDIRREYDWNLDTGIEPEFSDVKAYLIAEEISSATK